MLCKIVVRVDGKRVYNTGTIRLTDLQHISQELTLFLKAKPSSLTFDFYERKLVWKLIDSKTVPIPYKQVRDERLITDTRLRIPFKRTEKQRRA